MNWDTVITALAGLLGGGTLTAILTAVLRHFADRRKDTSLLTREERQQAHDHAGQLIDRLERRIGTLEKGHTECQKENAALREEVGRLREAVARLERQVAVYEQAHPRE